MKTYRVSCLDFRTGRGRVRWEQYEKGLSAARRLLKDTAGEGARLHWSRNAKSFVCYYRGLEYWAIKC